MSKLVYALLAVAISVQLFVHYPSLPDRIASHYDLAGNPNDWMSKQGLIAFYIGIATFVLGLFAFVPTLIRRLPASLINIPNRDYWLAPERRGQAIAMSAKYMDVFAAGTGALLITVFELTFRANQSADGKLPFPPLVLGAYGVFVVGWLVAFIRGFRITK